MQTLGAVALTISLYLCCDSTGIVRFVFKEVENYDIGRRSEWSGVLAVSKGLGFDI